MWVIPKDTPKPIDGRTQADKEQKISGEKTDYQERNQR